MPHVGGAAVVEKIITQAESESADRSIIIPDTPKMLSRILTVVPKSTAKSTGKSVRYNLAKHADQERFLTNLAASWHRKLKELKPEIKIARDLFKEMPRGTTLCDCSSFRQFCEEKLHVSRQGAYDMLGDYHAKKKAKKQEQAASLIKRDQPPKLVLAEQDKQRIYAAGAAGIHLVEALKNGDQDAQRKATEEIMMVSEAQPLRSVIFAEHDIRQEVLAVKLELVKVKKLFMKLLGEIVEADRFQTLPANLMKTVASIRKELAVDPASFGLDDDEQLVQ
jgi:hypothetical protein